MKSKKVNKTNLSVGLLGESMARQSDFEIDRPLTYVGLFFRDDPFKFCFPTIKGHEKNVRGHSTTTLTKFYPILITYPP